MTIRHHLTCSTAMALGLTLIGSTVIAQETPILLDEVILGYTQDGTPITAGENTTELNDTDLEQQGGTGKLDNVLRQQPGVFTRVNNGNPGVAVNIRGFEGSGRVAMAIDGVPQNMRWTGHEAQGFAYVDENLLAGVDITRGSHTTAGGTGLAGSVNFRTLEAQDLVEQGEGFGGRAGLRFGDNGDSSSQYVALGNSGEDFDVMFAMSSFDTGNMDDGDGAEIENSANDRQSSLLKLAYRLDDRQEIKLSAITYETTYAANSYEQDLTNQILTLNYTLQGDSPLVNLDVNVYRGENELEYTRSLTGSGSYVGRVQSTTTTGANGTNISELDLGAWTLTSINGFDYSRDELGGVNGGVNPIEGETTRSSLFSENIFANGDLELTAGLRYNSYETSGVSADGVAIDVTHEAVDPRLSVGYWVTDWLQPYARLSRTTRIPTLHEVLAGGSHGGSTPGFFKANPELEPEISTGYEIGFRIETSGLINDQDRLSGRVNYYNMEVENYIVGAFNPTLGGFAFNNLDGTSKTQGIELDLDYSIANYDVGLSYSYTDNDLPPQVNGFGASQYLPDNTLSLHVTGHFMDDRLTIGGQYNQVSTGPGSTTAESYELFDLTASYAVTDTLTVNARVDNLFDTTYEPWLSTTGNAPGRNVFVGASFEF